MVIRYSLIGYPVKPLLLTFNLSLLTLLNFFVKGHFFHHRIVFFQFNTLGSVFPVFGGDVAAHAGQPAVFMLGALQNHLNAVSFLCHGSLKFR